MNAIATVAPPQLAYAEMERLAADFAQSRLFGFKTKQEAMSIMMLAQAEGKHPATAARDYDVIQGRPAKKAEAMHRDFLQGGGKVEWHALTDELAEATFSHPQGGEVRISWDMARALQAGLNKKENWAKYPRQMLRNRTLSEGVRTVWPGATSGLYEPGEVADFVGKTIDGTAETDEHAASAERSAINDAVPLKPAAAATPRGERKVDPNVYETASETDEEKWWRNLELKLATARSQAEVMKVGELKSVKTAKETGPPEVQERVMELLAKAYERFPTDAATWTPDLSDELPDVEIVGEDKVAAG